MPPASTRFRTGLLAAIVVFVALWPLAHRLLVARYQINPWKFGGFAMYVTYVSSIPGLFQVTSAGFRPVDPAGLSPEARDAFERFRMRRSAFGRLVDPDEALRVVHADHPELEHAMVVVQRLTLDPRDGRIASEKETFAYSAGEPVARDSP